MSHDLSYFSGPSTSGAEWTNRYRKKQHNDGEHERHVHTKADKYADTHGQHVREGHTKNLSL